MARFLTNSLAIIVIGMIAMSGQARAQNLYTADVESIGDVLGSICNVTGYENVGDCAVDVLGTILSCNGWYNTTYSFRDCFLYDFPTAASLPEVAYAPYYFWYQLRVLHPNSTISEAATSGFFCSFLYDDLNTTSGNSTHYSETNSSIFFTSYSDEEYHVCDDIPSTLHECFHSSESNLTYFIGCVKDDLNLSTPLSLQVWQVVHDVIYSSEYGNETSEFVDEALVDLCASDEAWGSICSLYVQSTALECKATFSTTIGHAYEDCLLEAFYYDTASDDSHDDEETHGDDEAHSDDNSDDDDEKDKDDSTVYPFQEKAALVSSAASFAPVSLVIYALLSIYAL